MIFKVSLTKRKEEKYLGAQSIFIHSTTKLEFITYIFPQPFVFLFMLEQEESRVITILRVICWNSWEIWLIQLLKPPDITMFIASLGKLVKLLMVNKIRFRYTWYTFICNPQSELIKSGFFQRMFKNVSS